MHRRSAGDTRDRLIESHLPLVRALARRYAGAGAELDDLVQVGAVGLIKASDRFDPRKGVAFATFATPTIEGEIRHHLRDRGSPLRIPRELQRLSRDIRRAQGELTTRLGRAPSTAEVAAALDTDTDDVERALAAERARDSLPLSGDSEATAPAGGPEPATEAADRLTLAASMRALDERERRIVYLRFHADKTERQIARELGISQAHVSRLLGGALSKLRDSLELGDGDRAPADITARGVIPPAAQASGTPSRPAGGTRDAAAGARRASRGRAEADAAGSPAAEDLERLRAAIRTWLAQERPAPEATSRAAGARTARPGDTGAPKPPSPPSSPSPPSHSGRFLVRMPSSLHAQLALAAERENISLNRFVTDALAATVSAPGDPAAPAPGDPPAPAAPPDRRPDHPPGHPPDRRPDHPPDGRPAPPPARTVRTVLAANVVVLVFAAAVAVVLLVLALQRGI